MTLRTKPHKQKDAHRRPKLDGKTPEILGSLENLDAKEVEYALRNGITDLSDMDQPGFVSSGAHWSVQLTAGTTESALASFISRQRPCTTLDAFFKAKQEGLIEMKYEGRVPVYHRNPF